MIPQYHSFIIVTAKKPFFAFGQIQNGARLCQVKEGEIFKDKADLILYTIFQKATSKNISF